MLGDQKGEKMAIANALGSVLGSLSSGTSSGGSQNSAYGTNQSQSSSISNTYGREASLTSQEAANVANAEQWNMMQAAMQFNAEEAQKQRDWQEEMANTIYTRSVKNMIEAGINPILAASMGLSGASVGSGSTANISTPSAFMGQTFAEQSAASQSSSLGENYSSGSSWESSRYGLAEGLDQIADLITGTIDSINSANTLENTMNKLGETTLNKISDFKEGVRNSADNLLNALSKAGFHIDIGESDRQNYETGGGGGHSF